MLLAFFQTYLLDHIGLLMPVHHQIIIHGRLYLVDHQLFNIQMEIALQVKMELTDQVFGYLQEKDMVIQLIIM